MAKAMKSGLPIVGIVFLLLAVMKFINGGNWVVWAILGCLMGGLGIFGSNRSEGDKS
ncbi:hypothetical protein [Novosphingobium sp.]|uniref:hypothetical protein n=1 Tax=Novosphingobium sp. TaxID=1874826 RepID=UPI0025F65231|nr:hypothetical protein [Novosphingobium sp.]MCC6925611.1 hypothetical protein [Novosphingobium sp.]